ncbi:MAG: hypothetical protein J1F60_01830 [Oscillospiraceae bacterium]|nr:hypothetical protein [Oscillospiraceae bacterium]
MGKDAKKQEIIEVMSNIKITPVIHEDEPDLNYHTKIPFDSFNLIGAGLAMLPMSLQETIQTISIPTAGLYRINTEGKIGTLVTKNGKTIGNMVGVDGHTFSSRAVFEKVEGVPAISDTISIDPTALMMAMALTYIDQKLDFILDTQQTILEFLETDKKAKIESDIIFLTDVLNNYKFNWNDELYRTNMHIKVLDIKQDSEHNINFYRKQITAKAQKIKSNVDSELKTLQSEFENYQIALYSYGFSSFLEVMLLGNFDKDYLGNIANKINDYSYQYRELYTKCYDLLESASKDSAKSLLLGGLAKISGAVGETVAKIPLVNRSQIDETLIDSRAKLESLKEKQTEKTMAQFVRSKNSLVYPFVKAINAVDKFYNQENEMFFDKENLYLLLSE